MLVKKIITKPWMQKRGEQKRGKYTSVLDRWQKDEVYRVSQTAIGWTETCVKYLDYISEIDISFIAPFRQRVRCNTTIYLRSVDTNKQAGPLCQRPDFQSRAQVLVSIQQAQVKRVLHIPIKERTKQNDTLDPAVRQHLEWLSSTGQNIFHRLHPRHGEKARGGGVPHLETINGKIGTLKDGKTKNGGINNNDDSAVIFDLYLHQETCAKTSATRSQSLSCSTEPPFAVLRFDFWQFRVQTVATAMNVTGAVQTIHHWTHTRAIFSL